MIAKVNALWELGPLLSFGHLPLKGKTLLWELSVSRDFGQLIISNAKRLPFRGTLRPHQGALQGMLREGGRGWFCWRWCRAC
jgi:hypothetical protein